MQGYESSRFRSFFGRKGQTPGTEDRIDYLMLRRPKLAYYIDHEPDQAISEERKFGRELSSDTFDDLFDKFNSPDGDADRTESMRRNSEMVKNERLRTSMRKASIKVTEKDVKVQTFKGLKKSDDSGNFDIEEAKEKTKFLDTIQ